MEFKKGFKIKPAEISANGIVSFTDGVNVAEANQITCEAYGYTYNQEAATCSAFTYSPNINKNFKTNSNILKGSQNNLENATKNSLILGENNTTKGNNKNLFISGTNNNSLSGVNNSTIIAGSQGNVSNQGSLVIGGGGFGEANGLSQVIFIQQSNKTLNNTETALLTQYLPLTYIQKVKNCVMGFEANVIGINYGGEGTVGEYGYVQVTGAVTFTNGLASTYHQTTTHIVAAGQSGMNITASMKDVTATSFGVHVTGLAETRIQWTASVKLWQNKLQITF